MTFMPRLPQNREEEELVRNAILLAIEVQTQDELQKESSWNKWVQPCIGCKKLTKSYSDDFPWCEKCEEEKDISAYNWLTRGDDTDRY